MGLRGTMARATAVTGAGGANKPDKEFDYLSCRKRDHKYFHVVSVVLRNQKE